MLPESELNAATPGTPQKPFSAKEFAELSGLSLATVRRYLKQGVLPKVQPGGKHCRVAIPRSALEAYLNPAVPSKDSQNDEAQPVSQSQYPKPSLRGRRPNWRISQD